MKKRTALLAAAALALGGCATTYQITLMPRDSGKLYYGTATDANSGEGSITVKIEGTTYTGQWLQVTPPYTSGYVSGGVGGWGGGWRGWGAGAGGFVTLDNPNGGKANALLRSPEGKGLRCDFVGSQGTGGGLCRDDAGLIYDVQVRTASMENKQ